MTGIVLTSIAEPTLISECINVNIKAPPPGKWFARQRASAGIIGAMVCLLAIPDASFGQAWVFQPSVRLEGIYDDNFRLDPDTPTGARQQGPQQVTTARIAPGLSLSRVTDTTEFAGRLLVDGQFYYGDTQNLDNQSNQLADFSAFRKGELSSWGGSLSYRRDTLLRTIGPAINLENPTENPESDVDNDLSRTNVRRQRLSIAPSWSRYLTERTQVGLSYEFNDVSLSDVPAADPNNVNSQLTDYYTHSIGADSLTEVTERDQLELIFLGRRYKADTDARSSSYELRAGVVHQFSETTTGSFNLGALYNTFDRPETVSNPGSGNNTTVAFELTGTKRTGLTTFSGIAQRTTTPSASGTLVQTNQAIFNISRLLTERTHLILRSRIYETEAIDQLDSGSNRRFLGIAPILRYELSPSWGLETSYEYSRQKRYSDAESADSNAVYLSLIYERPTAVQPEQPSQGIGVGSF